MPLTCHQCRKVLDVSGEPPRFCPYCGQSLLADVTQAPDRLDPTTVEDAHATVAYHGITRTETGSSWRAQTDPRSPGAVVPEQLASYRLIRKLGQGGMGSVYEAEDGQTGRRVALKLIAPEFMTSSRAVERFVQEGRLASTISHPRCVFVLAADEADGWPFIVMELMPGTTLKDQVEKYGPMSSRLAIESILDVIEGLEEAHRRGVIHRDVKPSNCFVDADGRIKVGDFGLSKSIVDDSGLTVTNSFLGTPHFASLEQIKCEVIDERSDVYSVCATLYYLLTGHPPFEGVDATSTVVMIVEKPAPSARTLRPDLWIPLDRVLMKGLERDRKRRWANLEELRHALAPFLPGRVNLSGIGLRVGAFAFDILVTLMLVAIVMTIMESVRLAIGQRLRLTLTVTDFQRFEEIVSGVVVIVYFALFEILGEATPGKRLLRLRIGSAEAGPASIQSRIARVAIYCAINVLPRRVAALSMMYWKANEANVFWTAFILQLLGPLVLFVRARPSNGYRGVHEFGSGTAVVQLPWKLRRRKSKNVPENFQAFHLMRPPGLPETLGSFKVQGALRWSGTTRLLQAEDEGLKRLVWIVMRAKSHGPTTRARTDLARLTRLRWLQSGLKDEWRWDAYVAPTGSPLIELGTTRPKSKSWSETREVLEELATELVDASCDGTMPEDLAADQIWIKPNGRVLLLDVAPHEFRASATESDHVEAGDPQKRGLELIGRVAMAMLHGGHPSRDGGLRFDGTAIPKHALPILDGLKEGENRYRSIESFREAIHSIRDRPSELTPLQQFGHASYTLIGGLIKIWLIPTIAIIWMLVITIWVKGDPQDFTEQLFENLLLVSMLLWVGLAMLFREGPAGLVFNVALVSTKGRTPSRFRFAWRELLFIAPVLVLGTVLDLLPQSNEFLRILTAYGEFVAALIWPILNVLPIFLSPGRYLVDRLAGTVLVPR